jgi:hypothetical protein
MPRLTFFLVAIVSLVPPVSLAAQAPVDCAKLNAPADHAAMDHAAHQALMKACAAPTVLPTLPGQAAFGAISEIVGILKADPSTDWSKVNLEALRQHLIDMDEVTMRAAVTQHPVPGGFAADVTGAEKTMRAIRRMLGSHTKMLSQGAIYRATVTDIPTGARLTVVAADQRDAAVVARIRGLGFAGIITEGDHHVRHHLAIARGDAAAHEH